METGLSDEFPVHLRELRRMIKVLRILALLCFCFAVAALPACNKPSGTSSDPGAGSVFGKYRLHSTKYDNVDVNKAKDNAADVLTQLQNEPNVCLIGLWAYNPPAILTAVKAAGKEGKVHVVGFDEMEITLQGIKDGYIHGTVVQQPFEFGYQSVKLMKQLAENPNAPLPPDAANGIMHVPHKVIKKENVEEFQRNLEEQKRAGSAAPKPIPPDSNLIKVGFVSNNAEEFWSIAEAGTRKASNDLGVEVLFRRPKSGTAAAQKEIIEDLLTQGVKAIAISVIDPENQHDFLNTIAEKVPLITQDNDAPKTKRKCYIGTDNKEAGHAVGKLVKEVMPDGGTIAIFVGQPDPLNAQERRQGVLDELEGKKKTP
jgi:ribose transport system substrate-binding protein